MLTSYISFNNTKDEKLFNAISEDNLLEFQHYYKNQKKLLSKNILILALESSALSVISYILEYEKKIFKSLSFQEKQIFFDHIINLFTQENWKSQVISFCLNNYLISRKHLTFILLNVIKYSSSNIVDILLKKGAMLNKKDIIDLLSWSKTTVLNHVQKVNLKNFLLKKIKDKPSETFHLLSLSTGFDNDNYCLEEDIYISLEEHYQKQWWLYLLKKDNLLFYCHQSYIFAKKKDGYNILDWNFDFMHLLNNCLISNSLKWLDDNNYDIKLNELVLNKLVSNIQSDEPFLNQLGEETKKKINLLLLNNKLKNKLKEKNKQKKVRKNKI